MKSYIYNKVVVRLIMGLLPFYFSAFLPSEAGARKHKQLVILHTNDTHSTILPVNPNIDNKDLAGRGGFLRRVNVVKEQRELHPGLLLIDSGDFSQGSGYYTLFKGEVEIGLMNQMGYDAATIGNHEFDYGMDNMAKLFRQANFPIVCSNYDCKGTVLEDLVKPYITMVRDGVKIGLFALAPPLKGLVFDSNPEVHRHPAPSGEVRPRHLHLPPRLEDLRISRRAVPQSYRRLRPRAGRTYPHLYADARIRARQKWEADSRRSEW